MIRREHLRRMGLGQESRRQRRHQGVGRDYLLRPLCRDGIGGSTSLAGLAIRQRNRSALNRQREVEDHREGDHIEYCEYLRCRRRLLDAGAAVEGGYEV